MMSSLLHHLHETLAKERALLLSWISLITYLYELFKFDVLSPKCIYILLEEASALVRLEKEAQVSEIKRVLSRQYDEKQENKLSVTAISIPTLARHLVELANAMDND